MEIRSNGPSEEIGNRGKDNLPSWEGQRTGTSTIKGRTPTATRVVRNWEIFPRGEEETEQRGLEFPCSLDRAFRSRNTDLIVVLSPTDPELIVTEETGLAVDRDAATISTHPDVPLLSEGGVVSTSPSETAL